jgi:hypothetical protein
MRKQRGVTMIGWIFLLVPVALVVYAGIRVGPEYFNYYKVVTAMKETAKKLEADESVSPASIKTALGRRFDTGYVYEPSVNDIKISKVEGGWDMNVEYESSVPMFGNLYLLMDFNTSVLVATN